MILDATSQTRLRDFFEPHYQHLREFPAMRWMFRMFSDVVEGRCPWTVDLPTGAGKTELAVIWLLGLAWYGRNRSDRQPVPRRLVWVVNRRVLVQQVFVIAEALRKRLTQDNTPELEAVREGLRALGGESQEFFHVIELRGQIVANRDWAIRPAVPQLIIGTVDQIGSRLLFQGYGLGKWGRPQQAGLLGVDSWVAVDEAHLVPAFVLTLRQLREQCASPAENLPPPFDAVFARLPFWITELSATPGLPPPPPERRFGLTNEETLDPAIADRILASAKRRVQVEWLPKKDNEKPKQVLIQKLAEAAITSKAARIAIFVREVGVADSVAKRIATELKKKGIREEDRICKITGRIRGYERDHLSQHAAFKALLSERRTDAPEDERYFLVGTAAAEVGLDADADVILCDFASLPTLLQRLGRLDRRGVLSGRHVHSNGEPPMMRIFASREEAPAGIQNQLSTLAAALNADIAPWSAELMAGAHWFAASTGKDENDAELKQNSDEAKGEKASKGHIAALAQAATWGVLNPRDGACTPSKDWLAHDFARVAAGPVVVPPVTDVVLDYWSATTDPRSLHLSPHPWLYGLTEHNEGTPLVGVAFRLEVEALRQTAADEDETEAPDATAEVLEIFKRFPPLRAELHQVIISNVREWLDSPEAEKHPFVYRDRDWWRAKPGGGSAADARAAIGPDGVLVLPASVLMHNPCKKLLEDCEQAGPKATISDVLEGVSDPTQARYLRIIEPRDGLCGGRGALLWELEGDESEAPVPRAKTDGFQQRLRKELRIAGKTFVFRYFRPARTQGGLQFLDDNNGASGHLSRARDVAVRLAEALAPGDGFLRALLCAAARHHDEGKHHSKWQRAFGRPKGQPEIAKLHPDLKKPKPLGGFRHEWESLRQLAGKGSMVPTDLPPGAQALGRDLFLHLVGVHHGHLRPSIINDGLNPDFEIGKQNPLRLEAAERFTRLQRQLGRWRLAYLEALLKTADAEGSRDVLEDEDDGN